MLKHPLWFLLVLPGAEPVLATPLETPAVAESKISGVTLYSTQARIARAVPVEEGAGVRLLETGPFPATLIDDSLEVEADPHLRVLSVAVCRESGVDFASPEYRERERERDEIDRQITALERRRESAQARYRRYMELEIEPPPRSESAPAPLRVDPQSWHAFLGLVRNGLDEALAAAEAVEEKLHELRAKREVLQSRMQEISAPAREMSAGVTISVQNLTGAAGTLGLRYRVPSALWYPSYTVAIDPTARRLRLDMYAVVHQRTGEEWPEVPLEFSTSVPESGAGLPELLAQHISRRRYEETAPRASSGYAVAMPEESEVVPRGSIAYDDLAAGCVLPIDSARGFVSTFRSLRPEAVPPDGAPHRLLIANMELPYTERRTLVAELSPHIYRGLLAGVTGDDPLLEGTAAVFLDDSYLGLTRIRTTAPGEELALELGVDDRVRISRDVRESEEKVGVFSKGTRYRSDVILALESFRDEEIEVEVRERVPFTETEKIQVSLLHGDTSPPLTTFQEHSGLAAWTLRIAPRAKREMRLAYEIDAPRDIQLTRRDDPSRREGGGQ